MGQHSVLAFVFAAVSACASASASAARVAARVLQFNFYATYAFLPQIAISTTRSNERRARPILPEIRDYRFLYL